MDPSLLFLPIMVGVMYLFFIRPQIKRQKELKEQQSNLKKGQLVIINGSIHGKISQLPEGNETWIKVDIGNGTHLKVERAVVALNQPKTENK